MNHARPVIQMSLDGNLIKVFDEMQIAAKETGTSCSGISRCCRGKIKKSNGFIWKFDNSKFKLKTSPLDKLLDFL